MTSEEARTALVADDDEFFRIALSGILKRQLRFSAVLEACSFDEAIDLLGNHSGIGLALFDLSMPGITSAANLSAVRECAPDTKVAVVSGSNNRRDILLALEAGVHGYVPKILGASELSSALEHVLAGGIFVPPSIADLSYAPEIRQPGSKPEGEANAPKATPGETELLTPRQIDVLRLLVEGQSNKEIARSLNLGEGTIKIHVAALLRNLKVQNRSAAAVAGVRLLSR